jgi:hypothetical protein
VRTSGEVQLDMSEATVMDALPSFTTGAAVREAVGMFLNAAQHAKSPHHGATLSWFAKCAGFAPTTLAGTSLSGLSEVQAASLWRARDAVAAAQRSLDDIVLLHFVVQNRLPQASGEPDPALALFRPTLTPANTANVSRLSQSPALKSAACLAARVQS